MYSGKTQCKYKNMESRKKALEIIHHMPFMSFPEAWKVKIVPAFGLVDARFWVKSDHLEDRDISVYLDIYSTTGIYGKNEPYWEVFPVKYDGYEDVARFAVNDIEGLFKCIESQVQGENYED